MQRIERDSYPVRLVISSALIVLISFFYVFSVGSFFEVGVSPLEDGSTMYQSFQTFVFDQFIDSLLISIFTIVWFATSLFGKAKILSLLLREQDFYLLQVRIQALQQPCEEKSQAAF